MGWPNTVIHFKMSLHTWSRVIQHISHKLSGPFQRYKHNITFLTAEGFHKFLFCTRKRQHFIPWRVSNSYIMKKKKKNLYSWWARQTLTCVCIFFCEYSTMATTVIKQCFSCGLSNIIFRSLMKYKTGFTKKKAAVRFPVTWQRGSAGQMGHLHFQNYRHVKWHQVFVSRPGRWSAVAKHQDHFPIDVDYSPTQPREKKKKKSELSPDVYKQVAWGLSRFQYSKSHFHCKCRLLVKHHFPTQSSLFLFIFPQDVLIPLP